MISSGTSDFESKGWKAGRAVQAAAPFGFLSSYLPNFLSSVWYTALNLFESKGWKAGRAVQAAAPFGFLSSYLPNFLSCVWYTALKPREIRDVLSRKTFSL